jgi:hypothetical protein
LSRHLVVWRGLDGFRAEVAEVELSAAALSARGTQVGVDPLPYRVDYELEAGEDFATRRLSLVARFADGERELELRREGGSWECDGQVSGGPELAPPGGDMDRVAGALDCDLALSPLTNTMPVLRSRLHEREGGQGFLMAWVSVPDLGVHPSRQRYEHVRRLPDGRSVVRYVSESRDFVAELELDPAGLVVRYPQLGERVQPAARD